MAKFFHAVAGPWSFLLPSFPFLSLLFSFWHGFQPRNNGDETGDSRNPRRYTRTLYRASRSRSPPRWREVWNCSLDCVTGARRRDLWRFKFEIRNSVSSKRPACFSRFLSRWRSPSRSFHSKRDTETGGRVDGARKGGGGSFHGASSAEEFPLFPARPRHLCREE